MRLTMTALTHSRTGYRARKGIPKDARSEYQRLFGPGWEAKLRLPSTMAPHEAQGRFREWLLEVDTRIEAIRAKGRGEAQGLTHKQARALAGEWYVWFLARHEGSPRDRWTLVFDALVEELRDLDPEGMYAQGQNINLEQVLRDNLAGIRPLIADWAHTAQFLASQGMVLTADARTLLLDCVGPDYLAAITVLQQRAEGDYSPDDRPKQFPQFTRQEKMSVSPWELFDQWVKEAQPSGGTVTRWRSVFLALEAKFKSADEITEDAARNWLRSMVTGERSAKTVSGTWRGATKRIFNWGIEQKLIRNNPFAKIKITIPRTAQTRAKSFTAQEAETILAAAAKSQDAAKRWVPWLCAYSGARAGEISQLRGMDIEQHGDFWAMKLTPEAGTIKTREARTVPLHEHLIAQGFLDFAKARGKGPLFFTARRQEAEGDPLKPERPPAAKVRDQIAVWVRKIGVTDMHVSPNHAWRHTFKQIAERHGISERVSDAITGHAPTTAGRGYGTPNLEDMARELGKFPRYKT